MAEDIVCCADLRYTWKCASCHKLSTGFALPFGRCFLCGGTLEVMEGREIEDPMRVRPIRDAVQFELNTYHFYRLAMARATDPTLKAILEQLFLHEKDHLHALQDRYHTHMDDSVLNLRPDADALLNEELFAGIDFGDPRLGPLGLYDKAIEIERRNRDYFKSMAAALPAGPEKDICLELGAEEDEHMAILETEREQFVKS